MTPERETGGDVTARLYTAAAVRELDRRAIEDHGLDGYGLMCSAGAAAFRLLRQQWPAACRLAIVCGGGNNGGDGLVIGRLALEAGLAVRLVLTREPERLTGAAAQAWRDFAAAGGERTLVAGFTPADDERIVDALLGTGLDRPVEGSAATLIEAMNAAGAAGQAVLAVDIPSGLDADTGSVLGTAVRADATVTFIGRKRGLYTAAGPDCAGTVFFDSLDTPATIHAGLEPWVDTFDAERIAATLPRRSRGAHKGQAGRLLIVGGNAGMGGAVRLAGEAALRAGAGLVAVATHPGHAAAVSGARPELMAHGIERPGHELPALLAGTDAVVLGPGLGRDGWAREAFAAVRMRGPPAWVIDADGLNLLAETGETAAGAVLTPHPGEAARLLDTSTAAIEGDRFAALAQLVGRTAATVVLKGAGTLIAGPDDRPALIGRANPALATGGTGDVLAGLIGSLLAQGLSGAEAATCGCWLHARAGEVAADGRDCGLIASDLFAPIGRLRADPRHG